MIAILIEITHDVTNGCSNSLMTRIIESAHCRKFSGFPPVLAAVLFSFTVLS